MQNRRHRQYASYGQHSVHSASSAGLVRIPKKTWLYIVIAVIAGIYLLQREHAQADAQPSVVTAKVAAAEIKATAKPAQPSFPHLDTSTFTPTQQKMLDVMQEEYAKQPTSYDATVLQYTEGAKESWCADFVSVVRFEAGKPFSNADTGYWRIPGVESLRDYYASTNAYHLVGSYTPKFGDVAFYFGETPDGQNREHVAFVLDVRGDTLVTLGGNETDKGILQVRYDKLEDGVKGLNGFGESSL